jgi:hypothetical protein
MANRILQFSLGAAIAIVLAGCEAPPVAVDGSSPGTLYSDGEQTRLVNNPFSAGGENGLEVRQWVLSTGSEDVAAALMRHRDGDPLGRQEREALERNGLRLVRVPIDELDAMLAELGVASRNVVTWFGQVTNWRDVLIAPVDETSRALVVSGRVRRFSEGNYSLMLRSWTVMMEDMPKVQLELLGRHDRPDVHDTVPLLGQRRTAETWLHAIRAELLLESGYAYVMVYESPSVQWREPGEGEAVRVFEDDGEAGRAGGRGPGADVGPYHATGLSSMAPPTLGEVLLGREAGQPRRHLLAFVPRIPQRLMVREEAASE